jgi:hypothetical protein
MEYFMLLSELFKTNTSKELLSEGPKIAWARVGNKVVKKYRCTSGTRQGRIVSNPTQCNKPIDLKQRIRFKQTKLAKGARMARKSNRTKRRNPASLRIQRMNKGMS